MIGAGLIGGMLAHAFSYRCGYSVRMIEKLPDVSTDEDWHDRSSCVSGSHRTMNAFEKFGLSKEFKEICNYYRRTSYNFPD